MLQTSAARCPVCGSSDPQAANDLMATFEGVLAREGMDAAMKIAERASSLRAPHMNRDCAKEGR